MGIEAETVERMVAWRRDLHAHPELAFQEVRTAELVARELAACGLSVKTGLGRTGVVGTLSRGDGPTVGLRAGWAAGSFPALEALAKKAAVATVPAQRVSLFRQIGTDIDTKGPFFPLIQPGQVVATSKNLTNAPFNVLYWLNVAAVGSK